MSSQNENPELKSIRRITDILTSLPPASARRVLGYVADRMNDPPNQQLQLVAPTAPVNLAKKTAPLDPETKPGSGVVGVVGQGHQLPSNH